MTQKGLGEFFGCLACVASYGPAFIGGIATALDGEGFDKGFGEVVDASFEAGRKFGEEHGRTVVETTVKAATYVVVGNIADGVSDLIKKD